MNCRAELLSETNKPCESRKKPDDPSYMLPGYWSTCKHYIILIVQLQVLVLEHKLAEEAPARVNTALERLMLA